MRFFGEVVSFPGKPFIANLGAVAIDSLMAGTGVIGVDLTRHTQPDPQDIPLLVDG